MADVFISYSRRNKEFVKALHQALTHHRYDAWIDWEDIPLTADWWAEIQRGIEAADTFIFVITPASIASKVCGQEIDHAVANNKRLMPILHEDGFNSDRMHPAIGKHNWLFFRPEDDFKTAFASLVQALKTDLDHVRLHTRLLVRAREWQQADKRPDLLLRGQDLEDSEHWLATAEKIPAPSALHQDYIFSSRQAEMERQRRERRRLRIFSGVVTGLALVASGLAGWAWQQRQVAIAQRQIAYEQRDIAQQQSKIAFAHQLASEAQAVGSASQLLKAREDSITATESQVAFGLATLAPEVADILRADQPRLLAISPSEEYVAIITQNYGLKVWHLASQGIGLDWQGAAPVVEVGFSPDNALLTVATEDGALHIWRVGKTQFTPVETLTGHGASLTDTAFSPDGRYLATGSKDFTVRVWDLANILNLRSRQTTLLRSGGPVTAVNFSPDGNYIVSASRDNVVRVWSMAGENILCIIHNQPLNLVRFNADNDKLGSISGDTLVRMWPWPGLIDTPQDFPQIRPSC